ncbi:PH domain-containing protein [Hydrogenophaga sp.]|uniref:PH domain-containing protein n=1 Tax=Hydrogenophaga sp. TaxID=1904254 RepID=UPI00271B8115|nr:PH domain-containing protein [Hydrogenophaga sp.]MDO9439166.1 PH domain-containing protein [Hydrogenophaga sp.]
MDAWLVVVIGIAIALCFIQAWMLRDVSPSASIAAVVLGLLTLGIVLVFTVPCRYTLEADQLFIQCGVMKKRIAYADIRGIELSSSPLSAPALSLRRVKIVYGRSFQLVSPRERERFVEELSKHTNPIQSP